MTAPAQKIWFPLWQGIEANHASWVVPFSQWNVLLQYGTFRDLEQDSLRPVRDDNGPVLTGTADGLLRGVVRPLGAARHIDVRCKLQRADRQEFPTEGALALPPNCAPTAPAGVYTITSVRGLRLQAFYMEDAGAPWIRWRELTGQRFTSGVYANALWDSIMGTRRPQPYRTQAKRNPWVWHLEMVRA